MSDPSRPNYDTTTTLLIDNDFQPRFIHYPSEERERSIINAKYCCTYHGICGS